MLKDPVETATPCAPIHDRLPMILQPADYARCAGEEEVSLEELKALLRPAPAEMMRRSWWVRRLGAWRTTARR
jgi:putative SOS response-associated peptidase YedK